MINKLPLLVLGCALGWTVFGAANVAAAPTGDNMFSGGRFDSAAATYNPWAGVDADGNIHGLNGSQLAVGDDGGLFTGTFGPSVAVGDLNGDQKQDLIVADSRGFFWFYANSGTPQEPKFTQGQVMPVWLGENSDFGLEGIDNIVPRIQLVDLTGEGQPGLAVGTYSGKLFFVPNRGSATMPNFPVTRDITRYLIPTHTKGQLWCNYMAPFFYHWFNSSVLDLISGEGTYSANSIYLFRNMNSNMAPTFSEAHQVKIIPGMGREQLTPCVVDWNNDGKPDIITGDRTGYINVFLNTSTDPEKPTFDEGKHVAIGGTEKFGNFTTVTVGDLSGNKLPNLIIGTDAGTVLYAVNKGKLGAPNFPDPATTLKGTNPYPPISVPVGWNRIGPAGVPYELLTVVNPELEKGFTFPPGVDTKYAFKFSVFPVQDPLFHERYYPENEGGAHAHVIKCDYATQPLLSKVRYILHGWIKGSGNINSLTMSVGGYYVTSTGGKGVQQTVPISMSSSWSDFSDDLRFDLKDAPGGQANFYITLTFSGQGTLYLDDVSIRADK